MPRLAVPRLRLQILAGVLASLVVFLTWSPVAVYAEQRASFDSTTSLATESEPQTIDFRLLRDEVDGQGQWVQTFRMIVKPGGTLADASTLIYGTPAHVDDLFAIIKKQYPNLTNPALVPANLSVDITIDPRIAFVPRGVVAEPARGATIYSYYNGAQRTVFDPARAGDHKGISEIVSLPGDKPAENFTILEDALPREVPAGVRIAYYDFQAKDDLKSVVSQIYGTASTRAVRDFLDQTQWDPNHWPPPELARHQRLVLPENATFDDSPFSKLDVSSGNPANGPALREQLDEMTHLGIFPVQRQPYGTVYHIVGNDFALTARQVSKLLYGHEDQYLAIAAQAGSGSLFDLTQDPPQDARLFGRAFDVLVDYEAEHFLARETVDPVTKKRTTLLLNGTLIEDWQIDPGHNGLVRQVVLPSGYRKMLYRPQTASLLAGQILYTIATLGRSGGSPQVRRQDEGRFVSQFIWDWGRSVPHGNGYVLDYGELVTVPSGDNKAADELLLLAVRPVAGDNLDALPVYQPWLGSPFALGVIAVVAALFVLGLFGILARRV